MIVEKFRVYETLSALFEDESDIDDLVIILDNSSSFESFVDIPSYFDDDTVIESALESELKKRSTLHSNILFHFIEQTDQLLKEQRRYKLFGFDKDAYDHILENIPNTDLISLITTSEYLLFNYCQTKIKRPYIVLYRFFDENILIASDTKALLFARNHFDDQSDLKMVIRSVEYVLQRFKEHSFDIYIGGDLLNHDFENILKENLNQEIDKFPSSNHPLFLEGIIDLPKIYDFTPKHISVKRWFYKLQEKVVYTLFAIFCISFIAFFDSYNTHEKINQSYQNMEKRYKSQLRTLHLIGNENLNKLFKIKKLSNQENLSYLMRLLKLSEPFCKDMNLIKFKWSSRKRVDLFDIAMSKQFSSLTEMDTFLLRLKKHSKLIEQKLPKILLQRDIDFKNLRVNIQILSRVSNRKSLVYQGNSKL